MEFVFTLILFGLCMMAMAIGLLFKRKPLAKDCGLDPVSGERITDCACAAEGRPKCFKRKVLTLFSNNQETGQEGPDSTEDSARVVKFPDKIP